MRKFKNLSLPAVAMGGLMMIVTVPAFADGITLTLTNPLQAIGAGQTVTFDATVAVTPGNTADIYLNGDTSSITDAGSILTLSDNDFLNDFPLYLTPTGPGDTYTGAIFTVTNKGTVAEKYSGVFNLLGGSDGSQSTKLATVDFGSPAAATPEPSSILLLATGFAGLVTIGKRRIFRKL